MFNTIKRNKKRGFTLIELIIVIAIIAILAAIAVPAFGQIREKANVSSDVANARSIYSLVATELASDNLPSTTAAIEPIDELKLSIDGTTGETVSTLIEPTPEVKAYQNAEFAVKITDGKIEVYVLPVGTSEVAAGGFQVYPNGTDETKYSSN